MPARGEHLRDKAAVTGVGYTKFSRNSGVSVASLALEACHKAIQDAGLTPADVDGVVSYSVGDSVSPYQVSNYLGCKNLRYWMQEFGGGSSQVNPLIGASMAVANGIADNVLVFRAMNGRSGFRMGGSGRPAPVAGDMQFEQIYGWGTPPQMFASRARAHMIKYGTKQEAFGWIAITQRENAVKNERAVMRTPITMEDYMNSRWVVEPFHLLDCCLETDNAVALLVSSSERARDMKQRPVYVSGYALGKGFSHSAGPHSDFTVTAAAHHKDDLFGMAGIDVKDIDVAQLYDCFTWTMMVQLEDYGWCKKGEGGDFVMGGKRIAIDGEIPVNTNGGLLSEAYCHGFNNTLEAVLQLRGGNGERQVKDAQISLATGEPGMNTYHCAVVFKRG